MKTKFTFTSKVIVYDGPAKWYFAGLPKDMSAEIHEKFAKAKRGWGSLPVEVTVGSSVWNTSIFPDSKTKTFILPLKAKIRKKESIHDGSKLNIQIQLRL
jgi:hypothetical protein